MDNLSAMFREKSRKFYGSVKMTLEKHDTKRFLKIRAKRSKNVTTLLDFFLSEGCLSLDPEYHVPGTLIARSTVPQGLHWHAGRELWRLNPEYPVACLHGRHRLEAARKDFISKDNRRWVVNLYSRGWRVHLPRKMCSLTQARPQRPGEGGNTILDLRSATTEISSVKFASSSAMAIQREVRNGSLSLPKHEAMPPATEGAPGGVW